MTSAENGGTTTRNVFSGGDKQKIEILQNKINELVARLEIAENRVEGLRMEMIKKSEKPVAKVEAVKDKVEEVDEVEDEKGAEEDESDEPVEQTKPKKTKK